MDASIEVSGSMVNNMATEKKTTGMVIIIPGNSSLASAKDLVRYNSPTDFITQEHGPTENKQEMES